MGSGSVSEVLNKALPEWGKIRLLTLAHPFRWRLRNAGVRGWQNSAPGAGASVSLALEGPFSRASTISPDVLTKKVGTSLVLFLRLKYF